MKMKTWILSIFLLLVGTNGFCLQPASSKPVPDNPAPAPAAAVNTVPKTSYVIDVAARRVDSSFHARKRAYAGDLILVEITNPMEFMNTRPADRNKIVLYAEGVPLNGIKSDLFNNISKADFKTTDSVMWITFQLRRDTSTKAAWDYLYKLTGSWYQNELKVHLSVAWEGMLPVKVLDKNKANTELTITYFNYTVFIWMTIIYLVLLIVLGYLIVNSDILRETKNGAYSLAQAQLAFWTVLVIGGFVYSLLLTEIPSTLNTSILVLLGISMGTNGTAQYIDYFKKQKAGKASTPKKSVGFLTDILSDGNTINMQRFQIVAWNIVLGVYYILYTIHNKTMPVIPDVLLYLAGISSFTYVAAKPTEPK
jgi:xanthosine utilization system XapX-like protein